MFFGPGQFGTIASNARSASVARALPEVLARFRAGPVSRRRVLIFQLQPPGLEGVEMALPARTGSGDDPNGTLSKELQTFLLRDRRKPFNLSLELDQFGHRQKRFGPDPLAEYLAGTRKLEDRIIWHAVMLVRSTPDRKYAPGQIRLAKASTKF